jgi:REP element-mobilizing transposase RayT
MPTGYQIKEQDKLYYLTLQVVEWVDTEYYVACATKQILSPHPCLTTHRNGNWSSTERSSIFTRQKYRDIIIENLKFCQKNKDLEIYAYVVMSNHIHLLAKSGIGHLSDTLRDFKSFTSKEILKQIEESGESRREWMLKVFKSAAARHQRNSEYQFWTHENHAEHVYSNNFIDQKVNYCVRRSLCDIYSVEPNRSLSIHRNGSSLIN